NGEDLKDVLAQTGVSSIHLVTDAARPTICKTRVVSGRQQFFRIDREGTGRLPDQVEKAIIGPAPPPLADASPGGHSHQSKRALSDAVLSQVIGTAKSLGIAVLVDPKRRTFEAYRGADLIKPNAGELSAASGMPCATDVEIEAAGEAVAKQFDGMILVTRAD